MVDEMVDVEEPTPQYIPEPVGDTIVPSAKNLSQRCPLFLNQ